jgi:hypothetical protein
VHLPNIAAMSATLLVSSTSGWLNAAQLPNIPHMSVTLLVSNSSGWLNAAQVPNILLLRWRRGVWLFSADETRQSHVHQGQTYRDDLSGISRG